MPTFDVVSEIDKQEVRNALDQTERELATRFDFKGTNSTIEQSDLDLTMRSATEDRLRAVRQVLEEKLVKRGVSLKALEFGKIEEAAGGTVRQTAKLNAGISSDKARELNKFIKELNLKGIQSQVQGDQLRISGKKRDDLQDGDRQAPRGRLRHRPAVHELPRLMAVSTLDVGAVRADPGRVRRRRVATGGGGAHC